MKFLIVTTTIPEVGGGERIKDDIDTAMSMELFRAYDNFGITPTITWSKYTFIDERARLIETYDSMNKLFNHQVFIGTVLVLTHEQWLDKVNPIWRLVYT